MGLQDFLTDAKNILLGKIDDNSLEEFKDEIKKNIDSGKIGKAEAAMLMETRKKVNAEANDLEKKQLSTISLEDGTKVSAKDAKKKKQELELEKIKREKQKINSNMQVRKNNKINTKPQTKSGKLTIDRNKINEVIKKDERNEENKRKINERDGKN